MKTIAILIIALITIQPAHAQQTCKDYITDEWPDSRYTVEDISGDKVVKDNKTRLMWKQCAEGLSDADCSMGTSTPLQWNLALNVASTTEFAQYTDWRLPNLEELKSLLALNCSNPAINLTVFPNAPIGRTWTSSPSPFIENDGVAWRVGFIHGFYGIEPRNSPSYVRLVRKF